MPAKLSQPHYRQRRQAINRKLNLEAELLMEAEPFEVVSPLKKHPVESIGSPISIASSFEERLPEIQPILLPGAWVVVDRKGKPVRAEKMYDEPKKKKPRRKRARKTTREVELTDLEEGPSASNCLRAHECPKASVHEKAVCRSLTAKQWAQYRKQKQGKERAHMALLAALYDQGMLDDDGNGECAAPAPMKVKNDNRKTRRERVRRAARLAAAHDRCYWPEADDEWLPVEAPVLSKPIPKAPRAAKPPRVKAHNDWFPDEQKAPSSPGHGKRASEGPLIATFKSKAKHSVPMKKCSMM